VDSMERKRSPREVGEPAGARVTRATGFDRV